MWRQSPPYAESMFVRTENSEIHRLISVTLNFGIFRPRTENSELLQLISVLSVRTENRVYMRINFRPYGRKIANSYT